jgi:putative ATP-dependent endonuclease of the OLD family
MQNVRSFLDQAELRLDGPVSIVIGPNGGGKTNLLDTIVIILRRYMFASMYAVHAPTAELENRYEFRQNDALNSMVLERHSKAPAGAPQLVEVEVEVTSVDIANMAAMKHDSASLLQLAGKKYVNLTLQQSASWDLSLVAASQRFVYRFNGSGIESDGSNAANQFLEYLRLFEIDSRLREEYDLSQLATPLIYLPVNRSANGFQSTVELAGYNDYEMKRQSDATFSRSGTQIVGLAVGRLAQKWRLLLEKDKGVAAKEFAEDSNITELTKLLDELGYEWSLETVNPLKNRYDVRLRKQGSSFLVGAASSGERELLTYLFAIFALNVRDALIIVDEPELHLHPKWQRTLLNLFTRLSATTGNQFLLATHSPVFVSPESIQYVSRVFSANQKSQIQRLNLQLLPELRHLLNIVNSQNNERLFFADEVILVEGISDRIFFEALLTKRTWRKRSQRIIEVVSVGGKGFFEAYSKMLNACRIPFCVIADLDYVEQTGTPSVKKLFKVDASDIKEDVVDNPKSLDGDALVKSIDSAIADGDWNDAQDVWAYIKSRRRTLRPNLSNADLYELNTFLAHKVRERIFILSRGALEDYVPDGYGKRHLDKLIKLVSKPNFWAGLPFDGKPELQSIVEAIISGADQ